jgi:hypothetical protein
MGDPELRSDEKVLLRTSGIYVKSISFEGILTNRRILLIDRAKNLLPTKEIPLATINEVESGENAIRDQILTLWVIALSGETRQMVLTFSRQEGGNRIKERDAWARLIKENGSSSANPATRKVIPWPEPSPVRTVPAPGPKYEVVHSSVRQTPPPGDNMPADMKTDGINPARRPVIASPVRAVPTAGAARYADAPLGTDVFCQKCGNKAPSESVFCNRCGSPIVRSPPVPAPVETPAAPPVVQSPATPHGVKIHAPRPLDEEIHSVEPLFEPTPVKMPSDAPQEAPDELSLKQSLSWDEEAEPEPAPGAVEQIPGKPAEEMVIPQIFSTKSPDAAAPAPSGVTPGDTLPPPKPPRGRSLVPGKQTIIVAAAALVVILIIAAGALFVVPMLTSDTTTIPGGETTTRVTAVPTRPNTAGTIVPFEPTQRPVPATGVYVHINYLGGFEGSYGMSNALITVPGNSGDRLWEVENANGTVQAKFTKQDGSPRKLLVEIYKDGKSLTSSSTTVGHGSVTLSVDTQTGIAAPPLSSGDTTGSEPAAASLKITTAPVVTTSTVATTTVAINTTPTSP